MLLAVTAAACTGPSGSGSSAGGAGGDVAASAPQAARAAGGATSSAVGRAATTDARLAPELILSGSLSVTVRSVSVAAGRAETVVTEAGGRTDADDRDAPRGSRPTASLTLRVPNTAVPTVMNRLAALGHVGDRRLSTRDVTQDVADVDSRVTSSRAAIRTLRALYARATKVSDIIRIEATLSQREAQLEAFEARARSLGSQVALASITLELTQRRAAVAPVEHQPQRGGFVGGLDRGWHAFTAAASGVAVAFGAVLPFLLVLVVIGAGVLVVRRRWRPRSD